MDINIEQVQEVITVFGVKLVAAIAVFIIGRWIARYMTKVAEGLMTKSKVDSTLIKFIGNLTYISLLTFVILAALGQLGIQTTSFIAVLGAAGLAVGLALQGSLSNFAAGVLMIIFRPFKVGDYIEGAGTAGTVDEIQIFATRLKTPDNRLIIIPNSKLSSDNIVNVSAMSTRRVDMVFGISYGDNIDRAREVIADVLKEDSRILEDPPPKIAVLELADSSVNFVVRPWVNAADYWDVRFDITENMKKRFDQEGISIPFPQRDIHIHQAGD